MDDYLSFEHDLAVEVDALPSLSRQHIPSISIATEAMAIQEYKGLAQLIEPLMEVIGGRASNSQTLGPDLGSNLVGFGVDKPLEEHPLA